MEPPGSQWSAGDLGLFELCDIRLGDPLLLVAAVENGRTILGAFVGTLPVQLRGSWATEKKTRSSWPYVILEGSYVIFTDSAWPVSPVLTSSYSAVLAEPPEYPEVALITPFVCWNTA